MKLVGAAVSALPVGVADALPASLTPLPAPPPPVLLLFFAPVDDMRAFILRKGVGMMFFGGVVLTSLTSFVGLSPSAP